MATKDGLHRLIDDLPETLVEEAERRLTQLRDDPVLRAFLEAPEDDEPVTEEDIAAIEEARAERTRGELIPLEEVARRLSSTD
jgi:hypothetical protein